MRKRKKSSTWGYVIAVLLLLSIFGSNNKKHTTESNNSSTATSNSSIDQVDLDEEQTDEENTDPIDTDEVSNDKSISETETEENSIISEDEQENNDVDLEESNDGTTYKYDGVSYQIIEVDGGDRSGYREPLAAVDIGFGDREYWGLTNEYGQLVYVLADEVILQDDDTEPVNGNGRYYNDEANVPGTELSIYDQGHVIADALGGVSNAYNITPQESTLNRHGDQAYMEKVIRDAGGCKNFKATITYPDTSTQIPSSYKYEYTVKGNDVIDEFPNQNPEGSSSDSNVSSDSKYKEETNTSNKTEESDEEKELSRIDTNGNGQVTIKEAKAAGYKMPIYSDHWLYKYMDDRDHDGVVGE